MDNFDLKKYLVENRIKKEGLFGTSFEKEKEKIIKALDRWVAYSMSNGDSEADIMSVGAEYLRDSIDAYLGGKISDDDANL